jgi:hypothetical protein
MARWKKSTVSSQQGALQVEGQVAIIECTLNVLQEKRVTSRQTAEINNQEL